MRQVWDVFAQNGQTSPRSAGGPVGRRSRPTALSSPTSFISSATPPSNSKSESDFDQGMTYPPQLLAQIEPLRDAARSDAARDDRERSLASTPQDIEHLPKVENFKPAWFDPISELRFGYTLDRTHAAIALDFLKAQPPLGFLGVYLRGVDIVSHAAMCHSTLYPECGVSPEGTALYGELVSRYYADTFSARAADRRGRRRGCAGGDRLRPRLRAGRARRDGPPLRPRRRVDGSGGSARRQARTVTKRL